MINIDDTLSDMYEIIDKVDVVADWSIWSMTSSRITMLVEIPTILSSKSL